MKSIILMSAVSLFAAMTLVGCNQSSPGASGDASATNSSLSDTNSLIVQTNNLPNTNDVAVVNTNISASTNQ
jgi:predicted small secreted protein